MCESPSWATTDSRGGYAVPGTFWDEGRRESSEEPSGRFASSPPARGNAQRESRNALKTARQSRPRTRRHPLRGGVECLTKVKEAGPHRVVDGCERAGGVGSVLLDVHVIAVLVRVRLELPPARRLLARPDVLVPHDPHDPVQRATVDQVAGDGPRPREGFRDDTGVEGAALSVQGPRRGRGDAAGVEASVRAGADGELGEDVAQSRLQRPRARLACGRCRLRLRRWLVPHQGIRLNTTLVDGAIPRRRWVSNASSIHPSCTGSATAVPPASETMAHSYAGSVTAASRKAWAAVRRALMNVLSGRPVLEVWAVSANGPR